MTDLTNEINLITSKLSEKLSSLEAEFQRWNDYKVDYDALENQLHTLPDNTTKSAMIPLGKLAFMPGKLIHTNEILVLLGDQYYAERSAKQAIEILGRRRQVVNENLRLVEAQLNSFKQKSNTIMDSAGVLASASGASIADPQINDEGLPILEIREEVPANYDEEREKKKKENVIKDTPSSNQLPESVLRAREMMKQADENINQKKQNEENKALFDLLRELEEEEEEEGEEVEEEKGTPTSFVKETLIPTSVANNRKVTDALKHNDDDEDDDQDSLNNATDDDEEDDRYDTEISENMFDRFGDDEEYPLDGVVDQEDFTYYGDIPQIAPASSSTRPAATLREIIDDDKEYEKSTPKVITKKKTKSVVEPAAVENKVKEKVVEVEEKKPEEKPKKMSKFKLAQQEKKQQSSRESTVKENLPADAAAPAVQETTATPKKFSKFKLLRQQQDQPRKKPAEAAAAVETKVKEVVIPEPIAQPATQQPDEEHEHITEDLEAMLTEPKKKSTVPVENNGIPTVSSGSPNKPKKMSRFKLARKQQLETSKVEEELENVAPVKVERIKPKRTVTWDSNTSVRDHDNTLAPSVVSETNSYSQPMKSESEQQKKALIRSPADIFMQQQKQLTYVDDYPSLNDQGGKMVDLNELIKVARGSQESFWRPQDGSDALIPIIKSSGEEEEEKEDKPDGIIVAKKSKLDNKIMKGAVMERDIQSVDQEELEQDMDLREVVSNYQQMRQNLLASTGGLSFATKPEFEVFDEELPLPRKKSEVEEEEEEEEPEPKKMSRFKAARLGVRYSEEDY